MSLVPPTAVGIPTIRPPASEPVAVKADAIQYIRALAATLVVFYHQTVYLARMAGAPGLHDLFGIRPGFLGVVAFFVLSGYLMADIAPRYRPATFLVHRAIRIYPTYWLCVALAASFFTWLWFVTKPNADFVPNIVSMLFGHSDPRDLLRLTLAPVVFPDFPLGIEWTLLYETTFYVIIFAVSATGLLRYLPYLALLWLGLVVTSIWIDPARESSHTTPSIATLPFFGINAAFIFGILAARVRDRIPAIPAIGAGVALLVLAEWAPHRLATVQVAAAVAAIIIGLIGMERSGRLGSSTPLRRLGDWSYAMYLVHVPVILATFKLMSKSPVWQQMGTSFILVLLASAAIGSLDVSGYYRLKRVLDQAPMGVRVAIAACFVILFLAAAIYGLRGR